MCCLTVLLDGLTLEGRRERGGKEKGKGEEDEVIGESSHDALRALLFKIDKLMFGFSLEGKAFFKKPQTLNSKAFYFR